MKKQQVNLSNIKLIVTDMDGTLLREDQTLSENTIDGLIKAQKEGYRLCLASGRNYIGLERYGKLLKMSEYGGYYICANGVSIVNCNDLSKQVFKSLSAEDVKELLDFAKDYELESNIVLDDTLYNYIPESMLPLKEVYRKEHMIEESIPHYASMKSFIGVQRNYPHIIDTKYLGETIVAANKIVFTHHAEYLTDFIVKLKDRFSSRYNISMSSRTWIEVSPKGIEKAEAINALINKLNITKDEIVVFGDAENDLSMFKAFDNSFAMSNGMQIVKEHAAFITEHDNNNDGVIEALKVHVFK